MTSDVLNAVMLLPAGAPIDGLDAQLCQTHIERHGYELVAILYNDWLSALTLTRSNKAQVIVFAEHEHFASEWIPRVEFAGEETHDLVKYGRIRRHANQSPSEMGDGRSRRPGPVR